MKQTSLLLLIAFCTIACSGQQRTDEIKNLAYYTASSARWTSEFRLTQDSLFLIKKRGNDQIDDNRYQIVESDKQGKYFFIYVKKPAPPVYGAYANLKASSRPDYFELFIFTFSEDKTQISLLRRVEGFHSLAEVKNDSANLQPEDYYFTNWYNAVTFSKYTQYPELTTADKSTIEKVIDFWINDLTINKNKMRKSSVPYQENLSKALIANHLNPLGTMKDLDNKRKEYQITIPIIR